MLRLALALGVALAGLSAGPAFADASPQPPEMDQRGHELRAWLAGVWVFVPRPQGTGALRTQTCAHSDPQATVAPEFAAFGPYAARLSFSADLYGTMTRQVVGGRNNQTDLMASQVWDRLNVGYRTDEDDQLVQFDWGDGYATILVKLDATTLLVADDPVSLFQGAWLLTKCPENPG